MKKTLFFSFLALMLVMFVGIQQTVANSATGGITNKTDCLNYNSNDWNASWDEKNNQCLFLEKTSKPNKVYTTQKEFEEKEGMKCEAATDGCNNLLMQDGKVVGSTMMYCEDHTPAYSCTKYKDETYSTKEAFLKAEGKTCETATDGVNTHFIKDGKISGSTRVAYPTNFKAEWKCIKKVENNPVINSCNAWTDGCNTFTRDENGNVMSTKVYCAAEDIKPLKCIDSKEKDTRMCTMQYDPVCGEDGKTYSNSCTAGETKIAHKGACKNNDELSQNDKNQLENLEMKLPENVKMKVQTAINELSTRLNTMDATHKTKIIDAVQKRINDASNAITTKYPADTKLPVFESFKYDVISYLDLLFNQKIK